MHNPKVLFTLTTPNYDTYSVNTLGEISLKNHSFSSEWKLLGIVNSRKTINIFKPDISFKQLTEIDVSKIEWIYKNGKPKYTVIDLDHGTVRVWGNTKYHGIKYFNKEG